MEYRINIDLMAQQELEQAILYYCTFRKSRPIQFIANLESAFTQLKLNPFKPRRYKLARAIRLQEFPFALYYTVHEQERQVVIHSCLQDLRNPRRKQLKIEEKPLAEVLPESILHFNLLAPFSVHKARERKERRVLRSKKKKAMN